MKLTRDLINSYTEEHLSEYIECIDPANSDQTAVLGSKYWFNFAKLRLLVVSFHGLLVYDR